MRRMCKCNGVVDLLKHVAPHMYNHAEFGHSALNGVGINRGEPPELESSRTPLSWNGRRR